VWLGPNSHYHIGVVTRDITEGKGALSALFGLEWIQLIELVDDFEFSTPDGPVDWKLRGVVHSIGGPIHVELLQGAPGSVWYTEEPAVFHHVAHWVDDLAGTMEAMIGDGWRCEVTRLDAEGRPRTFAYMTKEGAPRIELSDATARAGVMGKLTGTA